MLDDRRVAKAIPTGLVYVCCLCERWYEGEDKDLKTLDGVPRCNSTGQCGSPVDGKSFDEYRGPMKGYLLKYCYVCGIENPEKALEPKVSGAQKVGCCLKCLDNIVKHQAMKDPRRRVTFVSNKRAGPNRYSEVK